ncbi:NADPH-dependent FMN reductase [Streptomyces sp. NPDC018031]|uniref:NADPH-dependent FMN reductase n=1 Tax=Streptomyces sp. NPDC018031 TaxID=3365033 RepID=UPI0037A68FF5
MPRLHTVVASNRPGSNGRPLGDWFTRQAIAHGSFEAGVVDLAEVALPFLDEPEHPSTGRYVHQHTKDWSATITAADALVWVMPMYNGGFNAVLKNAIDYLYAEWRDKPVALFSYSGGPTGGAPAAAMLKPVLTRLGMRVTEATIALPRVDSLITADGGFLPPEDLAGPVTAVLDELAALVAASAEPVPTA